MSHLSFWGHVERLIKRAVQWNLSYITVFHACTPKEGERVNEADGIVLKQQSPTNMNGREMQKLYCLKKYPLKAGNCVKIGCFCVELTEEGRRLGTDDVGGPGIFLALSRQSGSRGLKQFSITILWGLLGIGCVNSLEPFPP